MKKIAFPIMAILIALMLVAMVPAPAYAPSPRHCKGLDVYFYQTPDVAHAALLAGEIDFYQWSMTFEQYEDATLNPKIQLAGYAENGLMQIDINNNYTISDFAGIRNPMNHEEFRKAIAFLVDKDWIIEEVLKGFGTRVDTMVTAPQTGYANESVIGVNYPYPYSLASAESTLDAAGFVDTDTDGTRNYPVGWPGREAGPNLDPIKTCLRSDHGHRLTAGRALADNMRAIGIPVNQIEASSTVLFPIVMDDLNYHLYTGGWSMSAPYPTYFYSLFHTDFWGVGNYVNGMNASNLPNYPAFDEMLAALFYAATVEDFNAYVKRATGFHVQHCINIALWSYTAYWGYSKYMAGIVNMDGGGLENTYTFLNAYKLDDPDTTEDESQQPIRFGTINAPKDLNILYSQWYFDYAVLDRVWSGLMAREPYNLANVNPWIAQDWEVTEWIDFQDGLTKTKVTYWIRKDVYWHAPVTGAEIRQMNAHDVEFMIWYVYPFPDSWAWSGMKDVKYTRVVNDFMIEVYFDSISIFHYLNPTGPILPKYEYEDLLCELNTVVVPIPEPMPSFKFVFTPDDVVQVEEVIKLPEGIPLVQGIDFEIFATGAPDYIHNEIHLLRPFAPGESLQITYWRPLVDPHGYYLGNLPWQNTWQSLGPYYTINILEGVGGYAIMECNPSHFLGAPPLGEIDWKWTFTGTTKPRSGYYQVFLFDAVKLLGAYCSRGDGAAQAAWFPGADIDSFDLCHVGLYDAVQVLGKYGQKFGIPPDP